MAVRVYKRISQEKLSEHFTVEDFACKDGSCEVPVSDELICVLERLISLLRLSRIHIAAGYRTPSYAKRIGREKDIYHFDGRAADIICRDLRGNIVPSKTVLCALEGMGHKGGAAYISSQSVHVDVREKQEKYIETERGMKVNSFCKYFGMAPVNPYNEPLSCLIKGSRGEGVKWLQTYLNGVGFCLETDGFFESKTLCAVKKFQELSGMEPNGRVDILLRAALVSQVRG